MSFIMGRIELRMMRLVGWDLRLSLLFFERLVYGICSFIVIYILVTIQTINFIVLEHTHHRIYAAAETYLPHMWVAIVSLDLTGVDFLALEWTEHMAFLKWFSREGTAVM